MKNISLPEVRAPRFGNDETQGVYIQFIRDMQMQAFKAQGLAAFECSKRAAAIHEAGHAVIETALGEVVTVCRIERKDVIERGLVKEVWFGYTGLERTEEILFDSSSPADMIIIQAVRKHAGLAAETAFDPDPRLGSSLDELAMCQMFCNLAGNKMKVDGAEIYRRVLRWNRQTLQSHKSTHKAIVAVLMARSELAPEALKSLLGGIEKNVPKLWPDSPD